MPQDKHPDHACASELLEKSVFDLDHYISIRGWRASGEHLETNWGFTSKVYYSSSEPKYSSIHRKKLGIYSKAVARAPLIVTGERRLPQGDVKKAYSSKGYFSVPVKLPGSFLKI